MPDEPSFRAIELVCDGCGEHLYIARSDDLDQVQAAHAERHRKGICGICGHWNDEHRDSSRFPQPVAGWRNGPLICGHPTGMGDFCGCGVIRDTEGT